MIIAVKGSEKQINELKELITTGSIEELKVNKLESYDAIFDLDFDDNPDNLPIYIGASNSLIFVGAVKVQLEELLAEMGQAPLCHFIGMNTLPTFINRSLVECCALDEESQKKASTFLASVELEARFVASRVGLVTPRIVCMIINEAYYTVQEGTASREDIDLGMRLGTAYPRGPFAWANEIGVQHVYETLDALYEDTKDERYKICALLKTEYLQSFY